MYFIDRLDAGKKLATLFRNFDGEDCVVYGLPRGGVLVGEEIAKVIKAPFDLIAGRKLANYKGELGGQKHISCLDKTAILVSDRVLSGRVIKAAIEELKIRHLPKEIIVAVPVISKKLALELEKEEVAVVSLVTVEELKPVESYYFRFPQEKVNLHKNLLLNSCI